MASAAALLEPPQLAYTKNSTQTGHQGPAWKNIRNLEEEWDHDLHTTHKITGWETYLNGFALKIPF